MRGRRCFMFVMNVDIGIKRIIDLFVLAISYLKLGGGERRLVGCSVIGWSSRPVRRQRVSQSDRHINRSAYYYHMIVASDSNRLFNAIALEMETSDPNNKIRLSQLQPPSPL